MAAAIDASSVQSAGRTSTRASGSSSAASASSPSPRRAMSATLPPSCAIRNAVARPMPLLAPVITARLPMKRPVDALMAVSRRAVVCGPDAPARSGPTRQADEGHISSGSQSPGAKAEILRYRSGCRQQEVDESRCSLRPSLVRHGEIEGVAAAGLDDALEGQLRIEEVPLDVVADMPDCCNADSLAGELGFYPVRFRTGVEHHRDRGDALTFGVQELLPGIAWAQRLDQFEVEIADHRLGPAYVEPRWLAHPLAIVHDDPVVGLEDLPRPPTECLMIGAHL